MTPPLWSFVFGAVSFLAYAAAALVVLRLPGRVSPVARQALLALLVHVLAVGVASRVAAGLPYWHGAAIFWFGFNASLFGFSAVYKSVSLKVLGELARAPGQGVPFRAVSDAHVRPGFEERAALLVKAGLAAEEGGRFAMTSKGEKLARRMRAVQRFFGVERSGLYGGEQTPRLPVPSPPADTRPAA